MIYLVLILFVLAGSGLAVLTLQNYGTEVPVTLFIWSVPRVSVGVLIVAAFLLGAILLYIVSAISALHDRQEVKRLRKRVAELERGPAKSSSGFLQATGTPVVPMPGMPVPPQQ